MDFQEHNIKVVKTAQYYTKGANLSSCKYLWIMCHGYGMLAENVLSKMNWANDTHFFISAEGLSKFYWEGVSGRPVATWMTKKNRLSEIEDFSNFLSQIHNEYKTQIGAQTKIILFGFSQGGTTLWRWLHREKIDFDIFINYAGWIPEDIVFTDAQKEFYRDKKFLQLYGDKDRYLNEESKKILEYVIETHGFNVSIEKVSGEHKLYEEVIAKAFALATS